MNPAKGLADFNAILSCFIGRKWEIFVQIFCNGSSGKPFFFNDTKCFRGKNIVNFDNKRRRCFFLQRVKCFHRIILRKREFFFYKNKAVAFDKPCIVFGGSV